MWWRSGGTGPTVRAGGRRGALPAGLWLASAAVLGPVAAAWAGKELPRDESAVGEAMEVLAELGPAGAGFDIHETANYTILYNCDKQMAIQRGNLLEKLQRHYFLFLKRVGMEYRPLQGKLVVLVFERDEEFLEYARLDGHAAGPGQGTYLQGYYSSGTNRAAFFNQRRGGAYQRTKEAMQRLAKTLQEIPGPKDTVVRVTGPEGVRMSTKGEVARELVRKKKELIAHFENENLVVTQHEGAHQLAFNAGLQKRGAAYPFWVSEGLACTFESPGTSRGFGAFRVNSRRLADYRETLKRGATRGMKGLVTVGRPAERENLADLYAESWALFFFLARTQPQVLSGYLRSLAEREPAAGYDPQAEWPLFVEHFDPEGSKLEQRWGRFLRGLR